MKKLSFLMLVVFLSSAVTLDVARGDKEEPPEPQPIFKTRVINDVSEPVPVQGELSVSGSVDVGNLPAVQPVKDVDRTARHPFQASGSASFEDGVTVFGITLLEPVPEGKRLVITYAGYSLRINADLSAGVDGRGSCSLRVKEIDPYSDVIVMPLPRSVEIPRLESSWVEDIIYISGSPVTLYAEAGQSVQFFCSSNVDEGGSGSASGAASGYFIDLD